MIRRTAALPTAIAGLTLALAACGGDGASSAPALTDPTEIVTAALTSTEAATSVHLDVGFDGTITLTLPIGGLGGGGTPIDLTDATATADIDFADTAARATFAIPNMFGLGGEVIAVDGRAYVKTTLTGPLYTESAATDAPVDPSDTSAIIDTLGDLLLSDSVELTKGDDVPCGAMTCYTVATQLAADDLGLGTGLFGGMIDLGGATIALTIRVEQGAPNHLAGLTGVLTMADGTTLTIDVTASKWDEPVTIAAPPADQIKP
jgi:hypothetical protein